MEFDDPKSSRDLQENNYEHEAQQTVTTKDTQIDDIVDFIENIFMKRGADSYLGEPVTMSQHMLQTALLAEKENANDALITAALLHDIGHYTNEFPEDAADHDINTFHDQAGAAVLGQYFPSTVVDCIRYHVDAKRYLCATENTYYDGLSDASKHSLILQGGPMTPDEVEDFENLANIKAIVKVRRWDDQAKDPSITTPPFSHYRAKLIATALVYESK